MNAVKLFSWKHVIGLSLLISGNFYFNLRIGKMLAIDTGIRSWVALNRFQISDLIISTAILIFFSAIFVYSILKINHKADNKFIFLILSLLITFIMGLSFKMFFDIVDYSWHHIGFTHIYSGIQNIKIALFVKLIWFLIPFITSFILVILFRRSTQNLLKFLSIFGFVIFTMMIYQIFTLQKLYSSFDIKDKSLYRQIETKKERKVIWIIFDEFDHEIAFIDKTYNLELPNFTKLRNNSLTHNKLFAPAQDTAYSIPSMLIGEYIQGAILKDHRYIMKTNDKKMIPFTFENSIFGKINNDGFTSSITGFGFHPYCLIIQPVKCKIFNEPLKWYDGITHLLHMKHINIFLKRGEKKGPGYKRDINPEIIKSMYEFIESPNPTNFLFIHNKVPKICHRCVSGYAGPAEKKFNIETFGTEEAYLLNLKFVDYLLGEILKKLDTKKYKEGETLLILNSDHWARPGATAIFPSRKMDPKNKPYPALFIAKILGDNQKEEIFEPDSGIHTQELVHKFLKKEINTHSDIKQFFEEKSGHEVFFPSDSDVKFIVEKAF